MTLLPFLLLSIPALQPPYAIQEDMRTGIGGGLLSSPVDFAQMTIEQRVIIRVPMLRAEVPPASTPYDNRDSRYKAQPPAQIEWEEHKGPKCIKIVQVRAAAITSSRGVDLMLANNVRIRARLSRECRPASLYSGFYIQPSPDGSLCAGRDRVLARSGADCQISELKRLIPKD